MASPNHVQFGYSIPPHGPHAVTFHAPGWEAAMRFREGDKTLLAQLQNIYPRFAPWGVSARFMTDIGQCIGISPDHKLFGFLDPEMWMETIRHATSAEYRKDKVLTPDDLRFHVVEVDGVRLYLVEVAIQKTSGAIFMWQHAGRGFSTRLSEHLLTKVETAKHVGEFQRDFADIPPPIYLPITSAHTLLRQRVADLFSRATVQEYPHAVTADDVHLYQTGMAAIAELHNVIVSVKPDPVVVFGAVFFSTWNLYEESEIGFKHYGASSDSDLDDFERYLVDGGRCSYVFTEFPSNPILVSVDLIRLRKLADDYGFFLVVDDTVASFCNIDVLPVADLIISSLTKSFSGYADLLLGAVILNPNLPSHAILKSSFQETFHNQVFEGDAAQSLANNADYFSRSTTLNSNAEALATYFDTLVQDPRVPVKAIHYPPYSPGSKNLLPFLRKPTPEFPKIGYGCLLSVEFNSEKHTIAFYNHLEAFNGPHIGAHRTLAMPYNAMIYGRINPGYHASYGLGPHQVRISVGLEDEKVLLERCRIAVAAMMKVDDADDEKDGQVSEELAERADGETEIDPMGGQIVDS